MGKIVVEHRLKNMNADEKPVNGAKVVATGFTFKDDTVVVEDRRKSLEEV